MMSSVVGWNFLRIHLIVELRNCCCTSSRSLLQQSNRPGNQDSLRCLCSGTIQVHSRLVLGSCNSQLQSCTVWSLLVLLGRRSIRLCVHCRRLVSLCRMRVLVVVQPLLRVVMLCRPVCSSVHWMAR